VSAAIPNQAEALMRDALPLMARGDWASAATSLEKAASLHEAAGHRGEAGRCLQAAATLRRAAGDTEAAHALAGRGAAAAPADLPLAVAAQAEQARGAADVGQYDVAANGFGAALAAAERAGLDGNARIALLRGRMAAHIAMGELDAAETDTADACALADARIAGFLRTEQARLLLDGGHIAAATRALPSAPAADPQLRAEILVERARLARLAEDQKAAQTLATAARASALEAVVPVPYFAAAVEQSQALDALGDRPGAYAALTGAWGSLSQLLGRDVARSWVAPCLLALRLRWGGAAFAAVKAAHDARRRRELHESGGSQGERM
jgi:tetratricopeptide (TPR) repeat protein